jgi:hypothetical protein
MPARRTHEDVMRTAPTLRRSRAYAPVELDALRWERIDFDRYRIVVAEQFSAATRAFDTPKNHLRREAPLTHTPAMRS